MCIRDSLYIDGESAINWLQNKGIEEENIIIYGESLGTGIATQISQNKNFAGLILETPFTSMVEAAKNFYPYIPVGLILKDKYKNDEKMKNINIPLLIMHGEKDNIINITLGKKVFDSAPEPKQALYIPNAGHNNLFDFNLYEKIFRFLKKY